MAYLPTLDDLIQDLQLAKEIAIRNEQPNSLVTAVMAQAKLLGIEQQQSEQTVIVQRQPLTPEEIKAINNELEQEY